MKKLKNAILLGLSISVLAINTSCVSYAAYKSNENNAFRSAAYATGDQEVIKSYHNGDVRGVGIDLTALDVIFHSPGAAVKQFGAAVADAAIIYGVKELADEINDSGSNDKGASGNGSTSLVLTDSNNNTISVVSGTDNDSNQDREVGGMNNGSNFDQENQ
jgi:hypothetical protein